MSALAALPEQDENAILVHMLNPSHAVDLYLGDCQRRGLSPRTRDRYRDSLYKFADSLPPGMDVTEIKPDHYRRHLDRFNRCEQNTICLEDSAVRCFSRWLYRQRRVRRDEMEFIERPRRKPADELDVTTVSTDDARRLLAAAESWTERLTISVLLYLGPRRKAVANLRLSDYDQLRRVLLFREKGGRSIPKPVPDELANLIDAAIASGVYTDGSDYLIPPEGPLARDGDRDDRVVWRIVRKIASRAGVKTHVHALRAAFAVFYLEQPGADIEALRDLMGHRSSTTTQVYLRRLDRQARMETVRGLSWSVDQVRELAPSNLSSDAELIGDLRPGDRLVGPEFPVPTMQGVSLDAVDVDGVGAALDHGPLNEPVDVAAGGSEFADPLERVGRPGEFIDTRFVSHASSYADNSGDVKGPQDSEGFTFASSPSVGAGGFEPPLAVPAASMQARIPSDEGLGYDLLTSLRRVLEGVPA